MKYITLIFSTLLLTLTFLFVLYIKFPYHLQDPDTQIPLTQEITIPIKTKAEQLLDEMTPEQKVGQLFIFGFDGTTLTTDEKDFLGNSYIGGVIIYGKNISYNTQVENLIKDVQSTNTIPLFISIDQEGGKVVRLQGDDSLTVGEPDINNPSQAYNVALNRGEILKSLGFNMNFAPVVEYITDPSSFLYNRVFRGTQDEVLQKSVSSVQGYTDAGIIAVPKHFPGDSNTSVDSHNDLPIVNITNDQWDTYIEPFANLLNGTTVDALMITHIEFPNIDNKYPSSVSYEIINNRLVKGLNYNGLIISDDMEMDALKNMDTPNNLAKTALLAGEDILLYRTNLGQQKDVYQYVLQEVKNGDINIDGKVLKILQMKIKYGIIK